MSGMSELEQVADARRRVAAHARFPVTYWVVYGIVLVLLAGLPIWQSWLGLDASPVVPWVIAAVGVGSAVHSRIRRRRSGIYLRKPISAYPGARGIWLAGVAVTLVGLAGIDALVDHGQRGFALLALAGVAVAVFLIQVRTRSAMARDIEAGRVLP